MKKKKHQKVLMAEPKKGFFMPFIFSKVNRVYKKDGTVWVDVGRGAGRITVPRNKLILTRIAE